MKIVLFALSFLTTTVSGCYICGSANITMGNPEASYDAVTCEQKQDNLVVANYTADECTAYFASESNSWLDWSSFCGCEGVTAPETCQICGDDEVFGFPETELPWDDEDEKYTCSDAVEFAKHAPTAEICVAELATDENKALCCRDKGVLCHVCKEPNRSFDASQSYGGKSCGEMQSEVELFTTDQCTDYFGDDDISWLNIQSFCKCEGYEPSDFCTLCGEGMKVGDSMKNTIAPFEDEGEAGDGDEYTCEAAEALAIHVIDLEDCSASFQTEAIKAACCVPDGAVSSFSMYGVVAATLIGFLLA